MHAGTNTLIGKTALMTVATGGLGKQTAIGFASLGARVMIMACHQVTAEIAFSDRRAERGSTTVGALIADLSKPGAIRQLVATLGARHSQLHLIGHGLTTAQRAPIATSPTSVTTE